MRGYPFFRYVGAMLAGIVLAEAWPVSVWWPLAIGLGAALAFGVILYTNERRLIKPLNLVQGLAVLGLFGVVGWLSVYLNTPTHRPSHLANASTLTDGYEAVVTNLPESRAKTYKVELDIRQARSGAVGTPFQLVTGRVLVYLDKGDSLHPTPMPRCVVGGWIAPPR